MPRPGVFRPEVYIGGDNSDQGAWPGSGQVTKYLDYLQDWAWVRENVDGYYINNFALFAGDPPHPTNLGFLEPMVNALASKATIYETDKVWSTDDRDKLHLQELTQTNRFQEV